MKAEDVLGPVQFRFTDEEDVKKYGDRWWRYSEMDLVRLDARTLIKLERAMGIPVPDAMNGMRLSTVIGDTAAAWIGIRNEDPILAGEFREFSPHTLLIEWRDSQDPRDARDSEGKALAPESLPDTGSPDDSPPEKTSEPEGSVVLLGSPVTE